ncbi:MAG: hypothetical protein DDT41_01770 [candidate division WS2 bacterium]|nr:hypothetical protein [Candidatus Psychracetigena formicireducens]
MKCKLLVVLGTFFVVVVMSLMPVSAYWYSCPTSNLISRGQYVGVQDGP